CNAQSADEPALNIHALERSGENLSAAMHHQNFVTLVSELRHLTRQRFQRRRVIEQCSGNFNDHSHLSPVASSMPSIAFMFCTAWPAAPLPRLSRQLTTARRRPPASSAKPMSQKLVYATCCSSGNFPAGQMRI